MVGGDIVKISFIKNKNRIKIVLGNSCVNVELHKEYEFIDPIMLIIDSVKNLKYICH